MGGGPASANNIDIDPNTAGDAAWNYILVAHIRLEMWIVFLFTTEMVRVQVRPEQIQVTGLVKCGGGWQSYTARGL